MIEAQVRLFRPKVFKSDPTHPIQPTLGICVVEPQQVIKFRALQ